MTDVLLGFVYAIAGGLCVIGTVALVGFLRLWWMRRRERRRISRLLDAAAMARVEMRRRQR